MDRIVYWEAPLWQVLVAAAVALALMGWLVARAWPRSSQPEAPAAPSEVSPWDRIGPHLRVHRARPLVGVRRAAEEGGAATWQEQELSVTEVALLRHLLAHEGQVQSAEVLFARLWPEEPLDDLGLRLDQKERLRRVVFTLRQRIETDASAPHHLRTAHGVGYALYRDPSHD